MHLLKIIYCILVEHLSRWGMYYNAATFCWGGVIFVTYKSNIQCTSTFIDLTSFIFELYEKSHHYYGTGLVTLWMNIFDGKSKMQVMLITLHHHWLATIFAETTSTEDWNFWCILIPFCVQKTRAKLRFACFHLATVFFIIFYRTEICIRLYNLGNLFSSTSYKNYSATQNLGAAT